MRRVVITRALAGVLLIAASSSARAAEPEPPTRDTAPPPDVDELPTYDAPIAPAPFEASEEEEETGPPQRDVPPKVSG